LSGAALQSILAIGLDALARNYRTLAARAAPAACGAVVKADAYGLGVGPVAHALYRAGCRAFFVATLAEAQAFRREADLPLAVELVALNGIAAADAPAALAANVVPALNALDDVLAWNAAAGRLGRRVRCALHIDTGMNRLGLDADAVAKLGDDAALTAGLEIALVISHLACAEETANPLNREQRQRFETLRRRLPRARASLANSSGIFLGPDFHYDLVRPGVALYGVNPLTNDLNPMEEVINIKGKIVQVRNVDRGGSVGYGATHLVARPARIATVAAGYADGYPRSLSNRGHGYLGGTRVPLVGRVSMDLTTFDVTDADPALAHPGNTIDLIGNGAAIDDVAAQAGTIAYELLTRLGRRYARVYTGQAG
jgi:alanine racemase